MFELQKLSGQLCKQWSDVAKFVVVLGRSNAMHLIGWSKGKLCNGLVKGGVLSPITDICEMFKLRKRDEWIWREIGRRDYDVEMNGYGDLYFERLMTETE